MSAVAMFMTFMAFMQSVITMPAPDFIVTEYNVVVPVNKPMVEINCSQCVKYVNYVKNDTLLLENIAEDIERVCFMIYGPAAHECVNVTKDIERGLNYFTSHNSTEVCKNLHYC